MIYRWNFRFRVGAFRSGVGAFRSERPRSEKDLGELEVSECGRRLRDGSVFKTEDDFGNI